MAARIQPAVVGATGYTGFEVARLLLRHTGARRPLLFHSGRAEYASDLGEVYPELTDYGRQLPLAEFSLNALRGADVVFLATPHEVSHELVLQLEGSGIRIIDLSGAWRLSKSEHRAIYRLPFGACEQRIQDAAAYGLPELNRHAIASSGLVANAGCYATSVILGIAPWLRAGLLDTACGVIADCKSGVSGAGRHPTQRTHFVEVADDFSAYSVYGHRHTGEMAEQLGLDLSQFQFTPHLLPIPRGIFSTIYVRFQEEQRAELLEGVLRQFYEGSSWVRVFGAGRLPQIRHSLRTNFCDIGFELSPDKRRAVLVACLDNLVKGAAGQAVQNMNIMFGLDEREGLA